MLRFSLNGSTSEKSNISSASFSNSKFWAIGSLLATSELGGTDVTTNRLISKQPSAGVLYTSSNDTNYNAFHSEDVKFKIFTMECIVVCIIRRGIKYTSRRLFRD